MKGRNRCIEIRQWISFQETVKIVPWLASKENIWLKKEIGEYNDK
jgi:hypothetical protein